MKKIFFLFLLLISISFSNAQSESNDIDSLTKNFLALLKPEQKEAFSSLIDQRRERKLYDRLNTIDYDVAFVEEIHCLKDSSVKITEYYFSYTNPIYNTIEPGTDSAFLPFKIYFMADTISVLSNYFASTIVGMYHFDLMDYYYTLDTILKNYSSIKPVQELMYDKDLAYRNIQNQDIFNVEKSALEKRGEDRLKESYQIITLVNKKRNKFLVSVQLPAKNPKLDLRYQYVSHDW